MSRDMEGVKQSEIQKCAGCGKGVMHTGTPVFYTASIKYLCLDAGAVQQQAGLEMMMGAAAPLAQVMGPNKDIAKVMSTVNVWVCMECAVKMSLGELMELASRDEPDPEPEAA